LTLFSKGLPLAPDVAVAGSREISLARGKQVPGKVQVAFGRAIADLMNGDVLHFNLGMEDQWG
jgi:hypothetical protein